MAKKAPARKPAPKKPPKPACGNCSNFTPNPDDPKWGTCSIDVQPQHTRAKVLNCAGGKYYNRTVAEIVKERERRIAAMKQSLDEKDEKHIGVREAELQDRVVALAQKDAELEAKLEELRAMEKRIGEAALGGEE